MGGSVRKTEVIILHHGKGWKDCPFDAETWVTNQGFKRSNRVDRLFLMHKQVYADGRQLFDWHDINRQSVEKKFEVISLHDISELNSNLYPYKKIVKKFSTDYFTSSTTYMIAFAMYYGYTKIRLYGMNFFYGISDEKEDFNERCGVEYWIGRCHQANIEVDIHKGNLMTTATGKPYAING